MSASLRIGVLLDSMEAPRWVHATIERLLQTDSVEVAAVIVVTQPAKRPESLLFRLWRTVDEWFFCESDNPLTLEVRDYPVHSLRVAPLNLGRQRVLSDEDIARIMSYDLQVLVQLGAGDLPRHLTSCAKYGLWNFRYRGYGAWESEPALVNNLYAGRCISELMLYQENGNHDAQVLYRGIFDTHVFSLYKNRVSDCRRRSNILLKQVDRFL